MNADDIRAHCKAIADYDTRVSEIFRAAHHSDVARQVSAIRCASHRGGKAPILAKLYRYEKHILAVSRIDLLMSDQLNLRPWEHRVLLRELPETSTFDSDLLLIDYLHHLDQWAGGLPSTGDTWVKPSGEFFIHDVLTLETDGTVRPEFWTRCKHHSREATNWSVDKLRMLL